MNETIWGACRRGFLRGLCIALGIRVPPRRHSVDDVRVEVRALQARVREQRKTRPDEGS